MAGASPSLPPLSLPEVEGCGKMLDPNQSFTQKTLSCIRGNKGALKLSTKGDETQNSI